VKDVWAVQHIGYEDLGSFETVLKDRGFTIRYLRSSGIDYKNLYAGDPDLLIILGGPMGAYETKKYPWLEDEIAFAKDRIATEKPFLGICLGSQIIARACGKDAYCGKQGKEIGWEKITVNDVGMKTPLRHLDGSLTNMMHWHGDTFDLPDNAILLASSGKYNKQAYKIGNHVLAMQCHPEVTESKLKLWYNGAAEQVEEVGKTVPELEQQAIMYGEQLAKQATLFLNEWLDEQGL
jgi:GMP synthase (glutamine-hydrolysing)